MIITKCEDENVGASFGKPARRFPQSEPINAARCSTLVHNEDPATHGVSEGLCDGT